MVNPRPERCPHKDCEYINSLGEGAFCKGKLPEPIDHDGQPNTHRLCLIQSDAEEIYDYQMNKGDFWMLRRLLEPPDTEGCDYCELCGHHVEYHWKNCPGCGHDMGMQFPQGRKKGG